MCLGYVERITELEAACAQLRKDDAEASQRAHWLEARWKKLKEFVFDPDWDYSAAQVREKMTELERETNIDAIDTSEKRVEEPSGNRHEKDGAE